MRIAQRSHLSHHFLPTIDGRTPIAARKENSAVEAIDLIVRPGLRRKPCCTGNRGLLNGVADFQPRHYFQDNERDVLEA